MATRIYLNKKLEETIPIKPSPEWEDISKLKAYIIPVENIEIIEVTPPIEEEPEV